MGNGPSLTQSLNANRDKLSTYDLIAVNDMGLSEEYKKYKPGVYILCDPAYWYDTEDGPDIADRLYTKLIKDTDWDVQIYLPYEAEKTKSIKESLSVNKKIQVCYYNKTKVEGFRWFQYLMLKRQWGMFRAQNVIIAVLLLAIYFNYKQIYLMGADSDWMKNIWIDEQNRMRLKDTHFYGTDNRILPVKMHEQCLSLYYAFKSYMDIENYSRHCGIKIYNLNPQSFIDAFEKKKKLI
jgi:hypothetical protein